MGFPCVDDQLVKFDYCVFYLRHVNWEKLSKDLMGNAFHVSFKVGLFVLHVVFARSGSVDFWL